MMVSGLLPTLIDNLVLISMGVGLALAPFPRNWRFGGLMPTCGVERAGGIWTPR